MDAAILLILALANGPARIDQRALWYTTPLGPVVVPVEALPPAQRAHRLLAEQRLPLGLRVAAGLRWGDAEEALRLAASTPRPLSAEPGLAGALAAWAAAEAARLRLPADGSVIQVGPDGGAGAPAEARNALADASELLAPLAWPRWAGPVVLVPYGMRHPAIAPGWARVLRPALPVLRLPSGPDARGELTAAFAGLALDLSAPPAAGWPRWLTVGVGGCARARAGGSGIPERPMAEARAAAGTAAITRLLDGSDPAEPGLATAVVAALLHPARREHLPALLDLLRNGAGGPGAVATAYGLKPEALAGGR